MHRVIVFALLCALNPIGAAVASVDSEILSLTGNAEARVVFVRYPWCDENYNPIQSIKGPDLENENKFTKLVAIDSDKGTEKYIDDQHGYHLLPRFTRKTGLYVIWTDPGNNCSWIRDYACASPKRVLIQGGDYMVAHCRYDSTSKKEYIYTLSSNTRTLSMMELTANYTADQATKRTVYSASANLSKTLNVSADGKYLGTLLPWPEATIIDMASGQKYGRHYAESFGCHPNIAPDNSYRFFHLSSGHDTLRMWDQKLSSTQWNVVAKMMPGNTKFFGEYYHDCIAPRWSNHPRYFTIGYPLVMWVYSDGSVFNRNATDMRNLEQTDSCGAGVMCLGKFSADYRNVEKYVRVTACDVRKKDGVGDAWITGDGTEAAEPIVSRVLGHDRPGFARAGNSLLIVQPDWMRAELIDARGTIVESIRSGQKSRIAIGNRSQGIYLLRISDAKSSTAAAIVCGNPLSYQGN